MRAVSLFRLPLFRLPLFAAFLALLLLGWLVFYWSSEFLAPRQQTGVATQSVPMQSRLLSEKVAAMHLFGSDATAAVPVNVVAAPSSIGVRGIYAGRDGRSGFAVLELEGTLVSAVVGAEFAPGRILQRVYPEYVEILHDGQLETAHLPNAATKASPSTSMSVAPASLKGRSTVLEMAVNQLGPGQFVLSREELLATMRRPEQAHLLGQYTPNPLGGALLAQSPVGSLPDKLGLKAGDVITRINRKMLSGADDVAQLNEQMVNSEDVSMLVIREGKKINIGIQVEQ